MTTSADKQVKQVKAVLPRRQPQMFREFASAPAMALPVDPRGQYWLDVLAEPQLAAAARALVQFSFELQHGRAFETGRRAPVSLSVRNRRLRAARSWLVAVLGCDASPATLQSLSSTWLPVLAGAGPNVAAALGIGRSCLEFVRGLVTGLIFSEPADNLVPHARALQALETTLSAHLAGLRLAARQEFVSQR